MISFLRLFKKNAFGILIQIAFSLCMAFVNMDTLMLKSYGQKSLVGCSPWSHKELGTTEQLTLTNINPSSPLTWDTFSFIFVCLSFFFLINVFKL